MKMNIQLRTLKRNMICKFDILGKKIKMNNQVFISSHRIGELYLDITDMFWNEHESSSFNMSREMPFIKLLHHMASLRMRYYTRLNGSSIDLSQVVIDIGCFSGQICCSFTKIKHFSEDLFSTGDIRTVDYCMEMYRQYKNREPLDFFIATNPDIINSLFEIGRELFSLRRDTEQIFRLFYGMLPRKSKFRENLYEAEQMFKWDLMRQFSKLIITDGIYFSGSEFNSLKFFVSNF